MIRDKRLNMLAKAATGSNLLQRACVYTIIFKSEILVAPLPASDQNGKHSDQRQLLLSKLSPRDICNEYESYVTFHNEMQMTQKLTTVTSL